LINLTEKSQIMPARHSTVSAQPAADLDEARLCRPRHRPADHEAVGSRPVQPSARPGFHDHEGFGGGGIWPESFV